MHWSDWIRLNTNTRIYFTPVQNNDSDDEELKLPRLPAATIGKASLASSVALAKKAPSFTKAESEKILQGLRSTLASTNETIETISKTRQKISESINASRDLELKWNDVQDKFQQVMDKAIGDFASSIDKNNNNKQRTYTGEEQSIEDIGKRMRNGEYKKVLVLTGAGISTSCGIPDFRSASTGWFAKVSLC